MNYAVVVVTYNRKTLLEECIGCLLNQTVDISKIIIVDNASTDDTEKFLARYSVNNKFYIIREKNNQGGAYGFYKGVKSAVNFNWDWLILLDDDAMLECRYVEKIEKEINKRKECKAFSGSVYCDGKISLEHRSRNMFKKLYKPIPVKEQKYLSDCFEYDYASFCGLMIARELIEKIGYPERKFFIRNDDYEYSLRIRTVSKLINVNGAIINHKTTINSMQKDLTWKLFYNMRNAIYISDKYYGKKAKYEICIRYLLGLFYNILKYGEFKIKKIKWIFQIYVDAIKAGIKCEIGVNAKYMSEVNYEKK